MPATDPTFFDFDPTDGQTFNETQINDVSTLRFIGDVSYALNDNWTFRGIGTYEDTTRDRVIGDLEDLSIFDDNGVNNDRTRTTSGEIRLEYDYDRWSGLFGAYYFEDDQDFEFNFFTDLASQVFFPIDPLDSVISGDLTTFSETQNFAFFAKTRFELNDKWTFDFGIRYDNEEFDTTGTTVGAPVVTPATCTASVPGALLGAPVPAVDLPCQQVVALVAPPSDNPPQSASFDAILPRGAVTYNVNEDLSVFFGAQRGYRAGGSFIQAVGDGDIIVGTFDPEFLTNYEVGFRSQWLDRRLTVNGNVFLSFLRDQQVLIPGPSGNFLDSEIVNAGESTIFGAELVTDFQVTEELNLFGSLGLLNAEFDDFPFATPGSPFDNLAGNELPQAPSVSFTVGASYNHRSGFFGDASLNFTGPSESGLENLDEDDLLPGVTERIDGRAVVNGRIGYRAERFTLYGFVTNLFDDNAPLFFNPA
ncbi:MAG: TonB-dependent receptor, partial [Pseudomonadota bacterium]